MGWHEANEVEINYHQVVVCLFYICAYLHKGHSGIMLGTASFNPGGKV